MIHPGKSSIPGWSAFRLWGRCLLLLALTGCQLFSSPSHLTVFPGAEGFGTATKAGRGGKIIKVTNLKDSGAGSLRAAIEADGPRIVVFEVGGTITLSESLRIQNPFISIAGQTAPRPGITLKGAGLIACTHDVLVQHLRIRVGDDPRGPPPSTRDAFGMNGHEAPVYNVVFDHISASWSIDEIGATYQKVHDVTVSNSILGEPLNNSLHEKGSHAYGFLVNDRAKNVALIGNLLTHNLQRNPAVKGDTSALILNNVMYNGGSSPWIYIVNDYEYGPSLVSAVGNVFIDGPDTPDKATVIKVFSSCASGTRVYYSDNRASGTIFAYRTSFDPDTFFRPVWTSPLTVRDSSAVEDWVLSHAGARRSDRDKVDQRILREVRTRTGRIIDSQREVGGWPNLEKAERKFPVPENPHGDDDGDGYTNIEEILHRMAAEVEKG